MSGAEHTGPFCLHCSAAISASSGMAYCDLQCAARGKRAWTKAEAEAKAREMHERAKASATAPRPEGQVETVVNDTMEMVTRVGRGLFGFLVAPSTEAFVRDLDAAHGTQHAEQFRAVVGALDPNDRGAHIDPQAPPPPNPGMRAEYTQGTRVPAAPESEDVVVVIDATPPPCSFCKGRAVVALNQETGVRIAIACPTCKAPPRILKALRAG